MERLGATRHGLPGLNPLPVYGLPAPFPENALLYANTISQHGQRGFGIAPTLAKSSEAGAAGKHAARFHQRDDMTTFILGLYQYDDTMLVVAWDPEIRSEMKKTQILLTVNEDTLREAKQQSRVVGQARRKIGAGYSEEIFAAPLEHLDALIEMRMRPNAQQRMIDALGGTARLKERLNEHSLTIESASRLFHIQWCGPLFHEEASSHIKPFSIADRFVAPQPDAVVLYAAYDIETNVIVLWHQAHDAPMHNQMAFAVPNRILEEALSTEFAENSELIGQGQTWFREVVAVRCEKQSLMSAFRRLSQPSDRPQIWRTPRRADIHSELQAYLRPTEWTDWERTRIRPWPIVVNLPTLGKTSLAVFAYRANVHSERANSISLVVRPHVQSDDERPSFFAAGREPLLLGEWNGIYVLFDARAHPRIARNQSITVAMPRRLPPQIQRKGIAHVKRLVGMGEIEETIIFASAEHLLDALDLRLKTLPKANLDRARRAINLNDTQAVNDMVERLRYALNLPDRNALTGTRDAPAAMLVATEPPEGIALIDTDDALREIAQTPGPVAPNHLLWLGADEADHTVVLDARLRAVLQTDQAPRWPSPAQFDVLWTLVHAAVHHEPVANEVIQSACERSLEWLFQGKRAPFALDREAYGAYRVRLNNAAEDAGPVASMHPAMLDRVLNHSSLYAPSGRQPSIVWTFVKRVGRARILPAGSGDDVVFELEGRRVWVYGLTRVLRRSEDGQTDYVVPELSKAQLNRIRLHGGDHHVFAAFDPERGGPSWVFWSARPHLDRLGDPGYRLHVSADLPDNASYEWRETDDNHEEKVILYRSDVRSTSIIALLKRAVAQLPDTQRLALLQTDASGHGVTLEQVLGVMKPLHQIAMAMRHGFAPYSKRHSTKEIEATLGTHAMPKDTAYSMAVKRARASVDAGEAIPSLADVMALLRDERAEQYIGSPILLEMLRQLYGLTHDARPASFVDVFGDRDLAPASLQPAYRELVMRLVRGSGARAASTEISPATAADALANVPGDAAVLQPGTSNAATPTPANSISRDEVLSALILPDPETLQASYQRAIADIERFGSRAWPEDVLLPDALTRLPADVELVMRAWLGIWPYTQGQAAAAVAAQFEITPVHLCQSLIHRACEELIAHACSMRGIVLDEALAHPTLERLSVLITTRSDHLSDDELDAVLTRHGLAGAEPTVSETTRQGELRAFRPSAQYRVALDKLTGEFEKWQALRQNRNESHWSHEYVDAIYKRIDVGVYARILLLLRDPATRDQTFSDMVLRSVSAANQRTLHREVVTNGIRKNTMPRRSGAQRGPHPSLFYEATVTKVLGINQRIETFAYRAQTVDAVLERALTISDADAKLVKAVAQDGQRAFDDFYTANVDLARWAASRMGYFESKPETHGLLDDAMVELRRAIEGYVPRMSTAFSAYARAVLDSRMFVGSLKRYARRLDVPVSRARDIIMTRSIRNKLRNKAAAQNLQREPTHEELARAAFKPELRRRLVRELKAEPTASQIETGWRRYMPEFISRIREIIEVLTDEDRGRFAVSLDNSAFADGGRTLHEGVASAEPIGPVFPGDEADTQDNSALAAGLLEAFQRVGLSEDEQDTLRDHFGIAGHPQLPIDEIAKQQGISKEAVSQTITSALAKIGASPDAKDLLMDYLRP